MIGRTSARETMGRGRNPEEVWCPLPARIAESSHRDPNPCTPACPSRSRATPIHTISREKKSSEKRGNERRIGLDLRVRERREEGGGGGCK